ncbi:sugar kinase [Rhizobiaceae bacterium BDR2-2]|uniref:Sugar kinase n=1 Tax=Ectorhizobium quercum TaxID=2965071 RepID=A0AAE3SWQ8_9HYPH|nr:sugar kinase [Ectorhizobium quercum]MCX8998289.1 sugar kinase [Ectorhizobium quercum]
MRRKLFLSAGECMLEMATQANGDFRLGFAGDTLNTAWYARACLPRERWDVAYFTRLGADPYSARMKAFFAENGLDTRFVSADPVRQPGLYLIEIADGERSFTYWRERSAAKLLADDRAALEEAFAAADIVYFSAITLAILAPERRDVFLDCVQAARGAGKLTVFDTNIRPSLWESPQAMKGAILRAAGTAAIVLPSYDDEAASFGDASLEACAERYHSAGGGTVVVKNGGGPMVVLGEQGFLRFDGFEKVRPVDTTGAGDSFNGGFLAAIAEGAELGAAVARGHSVSAQVIMNRGALMPMDAVER